MFNRYYNREAVVISALQVEKHPLTTPGPFTPPVSRASFNSTAMALSAFNTPPSSTTFGRKNGHIMHGDHLTMSSSNGSPIPMRPQSSTSCYTNATTTASVMFGSPSIRLGDQQYRSSPKPHSSPKMKLRLKIFWCLYCSMWFYFVVDDWTCFHLWFSWFHFVLYLWVFFCHDVFDSFP